MSTPEYLYHYTNIETLALILKNHTIRFNSLDKMDDLQEQETADLKNIGQFCYISSWTDNDEESIPMWNMYASLPLGVRIRLKSNPFQEHENTPDSISKVTNMPITDSSNGTYLKSVIPLSEMFSKGFISVQAMTMDLLSQVNYTNDPSKLYPKLVSDDGKNISIALGELGKYKNLHWEFQNEWRYILNILPININQPIDNLVAQIPTIVRKIIFGLEKQPFPYYDMKLSQEAFENMEITLSPNLSAGSRVIVQSLVDKYNPSASIKDSSLIGLI